MYSAKTNSCLKMLYIIIISSLRKHLVTVDRKILPLTGRNLEQNKILRWAIACLASAGWNGERGQTYCYECKAFIECLSYSMLLFFVARASVCFIVLLTVSQKIITHPHKINKAILSHLFHISNRIGPYTFCPPPIPPQAPTRPLRPTFKCCLLNLFCSNA